MPLGHALLEHALAGHVLLARVLLQHAPPSPEMWLGQARQMLRQLAGSSHEPATPLPPAALALQQAPASASWPRETASTMMAVAPPALQTMETVQIVCRNCAGEKPMTKP